MTPEEARAHLDNELAQMRSRTREDKTRLSYWFPLIEAAGIPAPKTIILPTLTPKEEGELCDWAAGEGSYDGLPYLIGDINQAAIAFGYPCFLRTDYSSAKHSWSKSCFLASATQIKESIQSIAEYSIMADLMGLPIDRWVVRELLPTKPVFHAFRDMPIVREFRVFVRDSVIEHWQPYWPLHALEGQTEEPNWRELASQLNSITPEERAKVEGLALRVSAAVPGYWSVDCLDVVGRGWMVTDMAEGDKSYRWDPNESA
jgi:hypothetical protein